jgi:hypothetical protein
MPCDRCETHGLPCAFNTVRNKRGPRFGIGTVINELRAHTPAPPASPLRPFGIMAVDRASSDHQAARAAQTPPAYPSIAATSPHTHREAVPVEIPPGQSEPQCSPSGSMDNAYYTFDDFAQNMLSSTFLPQEQAPALGHSLAPVRYRFEPSLSFNRDSMAYTTRDTTHQSPSITIEYQQVDWHQVEQGLHLFCERMYYIYPIVNRQHLCLLVKDPQRLKRVEARLLWSICALTLMAVDAWPSFDLQSRTKAAREHIRRCLEDRTHSDYAEIVAPDDVLTSLFIAVTFFDLKCRNQAWFYIREAISLAQLAGMHVIDEESKLDPTEKIRRQRIYALLYVTERGAFIHDMLPVSIFVSPKLLCERLPDEDSSVSSGLDMLFYLFSLLTYDFVRARSRFSSMGSTGDEYDIFADLQERLRQDMDVTAVSEIQRADILITQQWLRLVVWQTALKLGLISSTATDPSYTYSYPVQIALALCEVIKTLPSTAIEVHGLGIVSALVLSG